MAEDAYGLELTTASAEAGDLFVEAMGRALALRAGAGPLLEQATDIDPGFALAWALLGFQLRAQGDILGGNELVARAGDLGAGTEREQRHLEVLSLFVGGRYPKALAAAEVHLARWPGDALVLMQAHFLLNIFSPDPDRKQRHRRLVDGVAASLPDDWYVLGELAFAAAEDTAYDVAGEAANRSLEANPDNAAAAHALTHVHLETGTIDDGERWLDGWLAAWTDPSGFGCHLAWHRALLRLAAGQEVDGDVASILAFRGRSIGVLNDGASLLWRLHLGGATDLPWDALADLFSPPGFSFGNFHRAFVLGGLGDGNGLDELAGTLRDLAAAGHPTASVCADVVTAVRRLGDGDAAGAADLLVAAEPDLPGLGGSRAQLEVLEDTTIVALTRAGRGGEARSRLARRAARRPTPRDQAWLSELDAPAPFG